MPTPRATLLIAGVLSAACSASAQTPPAAPAPRPADSSNAAPHRPPRVDISKLKFMTGCWEVRLDKDNHAEEIWTTLSENLLVSTTRYFNKEFATGYDFNRIEVTDTGVVLSILAKGKPEETYLMKTLVDEYVLFENTKKAFPQRIMYRLASDGALIPRNEGDGPSVEVRFRRIKCPGADIKLRP